MHEGSGSTTTSVGNLASELASFFAHFDQPKRNDLHLLDFWGTCSFYVDFLGYSMLQNCVDLLQTILKACGDFTQGLPLSHSIGEHFLRLMGCVIDDI